VRPAAWTLLVLLIASVAAADDFTFDISRYEKKPYEFGGYIQASAEYLRLNRDSVLYQSAYPDGSSKSDDRYRGVLELSGLYRHDIFSLNGLLNAWIMEDVSGYGDDVRFYELFAAAQLSDALKIEVGKRVLRWGKGYAFNPAAFLERPKNPIDPDLSREGYVMALAEYVRTLEGRLQTVSISVMAVPVGSGMNEDFGDKNHLNTAARLYLLYRDTDIDVMVRSGGSRPAAAGLDMARNLMPNFAIHGELAWFENRTISIPDSQDTFSKPFLRKADDLDVLFGLRYLTASETTWIIEYYRNGAGYSPREMKAFFAWMRSSTDSAPDMGSEPVSSTEPLGEPDVGQDTSGRLIFETSGILSGPQLMRDYLHVRVARKEPFDVLYWNAGFTAIINLQDNSASLVPEVIYTGITNLELRARLPLLAGGTNTEYGERRNRWRAEFRGRYYF
jgi:hypothetical protein